ncbi:MAG TPA: hypothetical protein VNZ62_04470 [Capillimicrobium sp.]|nr:hypothetical protein [Capillimicrobium sp.]
MDKSKPTRVPARGKSDTERATEIKALMARLVVAVSVASDNDNDRRAAWAEVATYAGAVHRRARLLAGLGRGG